MNKKKKKKKNFTKPPVGVSFKCFVSFSSEKYRTKNEQTKTILIARMGRQNPYILIWTGAWLANRSSSGFGHLRRDLSIQSQWRFRSDCLLPFGNRYFLMWTYFAFDGFCFVLPLSFEKKKRKKRVKYRPLWQLNFFPGHHEPVDRH